MIKTLGREPLQRLPLLVKLATLLLGHWGNVAPQPTGAKLWGTGKPRSSKIKAIGVAAVS